MLGLWLKRWLHRGRRGLSSCEGLWRRLGYRSAACYGLDLLNGKLHLGFFPMFLTETLVFLIHVLNQLLHVIACNGVFVDVSGADAQMKGFIAFFLLGTLFESAALSA